MRASLLASSLLACVLLFPGIEGSEEVKEADVLTLIKLTVAMEAEGEPPMGKLAVAYVIMNRVRQWDKSVSDVIFKDYQFTCWERGSPTKMRLDDIPEWVMDDAEYAALSAFRQTQLDPTQGATHYLNENLTRQIRGGSLPNWVWSMEKVAVIGKHTFYK